MRGDQQSLINSGFASAPKDSRDFLRLVVILGVNNSDFRMGMVGISQAFLQSSYIHQTERVIAIAPPYIRFGEGANDDVSWRGFVAINHSADNFEDEQGKKSPQ